MRASIASRLRTLTVSEFRLRDQGTVLGFLWTLLHPLLMFSVLWTVFSAWMGEKVRDFSGHLLTGIVLWNFFANATAFGLTSLERRRGLVLWMNLPRELLVGAAVGSVWLSFLLELLLLVVVLACLGHLAGASLALLPLVVLAETALALGAALALAALQVRVRDTERIWGVLLMAGFFATPVFYASEVVSGPWRHWMWLNPMASVLACGRQALLGQAAPARAWEALAASSVLALAAGATLFRRLTRDAAERL